ncbi:MAG: hypothetical protein Q9170_000312 [Blastenia crenularia]
METLRIMIGRSQTYGIKCTAEIYENLGKNRLWQRQLKNVVTTTILVSICLVPGISATIGRAAYLGAITTVFCHPGRRFGQLVEALVLATAGTAIGLAWSLLGFYLSSYFSGSSPAAAYSIRGVFLTCALLFHGYLRSKTPRLFVFVLLLVIVSVVTSTSTASHVTPLSATQIFYPILLAVGIILTINLLLFPEFSASFLGETIIGTLHDTTEALRKASQYFTELAVSANNPEGASAKWTGTAAGSAVGISRPISTSSSNHLIENWLQWKQQKRRTSADTHKEPTPITLKELIGLKTSLRSKLSSCKTAQSECNFEIAFAVLPPRNLKPISTHSMRRLVANAIAVIGACESKFALLGEGDEQDDSTDHEPKRYPSRPTSGQYPAKVLKDHSNWSAQARNSSAVHGAVLKENATANDEKLELDHIRPRKEIEFGDVKLLQRLLRQISIPHQKLITVAFRAIDCATVCIAYSYDVANLPSGAKVPKGLSVEELDIYIDELKGALISFDDEIAAALAHALEKDGSDGEQLDIMPREEIFLVASFVLNLRQAVGHIEDILRCSRSLVLQRQSRHEHRRFYAPRIRWSKWLYSGGAEDEALPAVGRKHHRMGEVDDKADDEPGMYPSDSEENLVKSVPRKRDLEVGPSRDLPKLAELPSQTTVASEGPPRLLKGTTRLRGILADGLEWVQNSDDLLYAFKLSAAVMLVTWPAFVARWNGWFSLNRGLWAALQLVLITEVSIGTSVITFFLRGIGTTLGCLWGWAALEARGGNRIVAAAMIFVGLIPCTYVQLGTRYPKAGMVCIVSICVVALSTELQTVPGGIVALVVEVAFLPVKARTRLVESLATAIRQIRAMELCIAVGIEEGDALDIYNPGVIERFERANGKANGALEAAEMFPDRMENLLQLRTAYGSGPLEESNAQMAPYRRNVTGSISLTLFAIETSLISKVSLPQFFPSARLGHLRMINRAREIVQQAASQECNRSLSDPIRRRVVRQKYLAWNAASAARAEIIEYLEELIDLAKLVVGANEFRSGLLMRTTYQHYTQQLADVAGEGLGAERAAESGGKAGNASAPAQAEKSGSTRRRRLTTVQSSSSAENQVPASLQRIQSRKIEAGIRRRATKEGWDR